MAATRKMTRGLAFVACAITMGCTWSEPHRLAYGECMDQMRAYEAELVGVRDEVFFRGVDKHDYCWQLANGRVRELKRRGLLFTDRR